MLLPLFLAVGMGLLAVAYAWSIPIVLGAAAMFWTLWTFVVKEHRTVVEDGTATPAGDLARTFWFFSAPRAWPPSAPWPWCGSTCCWSAT